MTQPTEPAATAEIVAPAARYYRMTRYLMVAMLFVFGFWFLRDGFVAWPKEIKEHLAEFPDAKPPHTDLDVALNKLLGIVLPPAAIGLLIWALYNSRQSYRFSNGILTVPGHPAVPLTAIKSVDRKLWDRKGIAYVNYELADGTKGRLRLDDYVYERGPTDRIYELVDKADPTAVVQPTVRAVAVVPAATPRAVASAQKKGTGSVVPPVPPNSSQKPKPPV